MSTEATVTIDGRELRLSNPDKIMYPAADFRKSDVIGYYRAIAPVLLPHMRKRPLTLKRYPNGIDGTFFYEKNCPSHRPPWVKTAEVEVKGGRKVAFCLANDLPTLIWVANLASIELHTSLARAPRLERPSMLVFDLDPGAPADVLDCADIALLLRAVLDDQKLRSFVKTSGSKGLQMFVPLNTAVGFDDTRSYAQAIARLMEERLPERVVSSMSKDVRHGRVFIDWSQNAGHKTTISVYSLRARERPNISTPLHWEEVEVAAARRDVTLLQFEAADVVERVASDGDLFAPLLDLKQKLPRV